MAVYKNEQQQTPEIEPEENWELEADTERPAFSLNHGFYKPTPLRYGLVCFCCKTEGHRHHRCPVREGLPKDFLTPYCERCKKKGHATKHCGKTPIRTPIQGRTVDPPKYMMKIGEKNFETLIDTGNKMSFLNKNIYDTLPYKPSLWGQHIELLAANVSALRIDGVVELSSEIGGQNISQEYAIIKDLYPPVILGMDWIINNRVQLYSNAIKLNGKLIRKMEH